MNKRYIIAKNLEYNLNFIKENCNSKICAVVKGDAYGHGLQSIVKILKSKVDFFAVANDIEANHFRRIDKNSKLLILGKCEDINFSIENKISVTVISYKQLKEIEKRAKKLNCSCNVHIKIDSGMNRIGISTFNEFKKCLHLIKNSSKIILEGVFTHFCSLRSDKAYFEKQKSFFYKMIKYLPKTMNPIIHVGGSLSLLKKIKYDMIRVGIYLYGYNHPNLKKVMYITSQVVNTKSIKKGDQVGYSSYFIAKKDMYIATISIGYYDGLWYNFKNMRVENALAKENDNINKQIHYLSICMDMSIIENENKKLKIGDEITVFNDAEIWQRYMGVNTHAVLIEFAKLRAKTIII